MRYFLRSQIREKIKASIIASRDAGREICGLLVDNGHVIETIEVRNKVKRGGGFEFYYGEVRSLVKASGIIGHEVVGTFHSHPLSIAKPGDGDIANSVDDSLMLIIDVKDKTAKLWHIFNGAAKEVKYRLL